MVQNPSVFALDFQHRVSFLSPFVRRKIRVLSNNTSIDSTLLREWRRSTASGTVCMCKQANASANILFSLRTQTREYNGQPIIQRTTSEWECHSQTAWRRAQITPKAHIHTPNNSSTGNDTKIFPAVWKRTKSCSFAFDIAFAIFKCSIWFDWRLREIGGCCGGRGWFSLRGCRAGWSERVAPRRTERLLLESRGMARSERNQFGRIVDICPSRINVTAVRGNFSNKCVYQPAYAWVFHVYYITLYKLPGGSLRFRAHFPLIAFRTPHWSARFVMSSFRNGITDFDQCVCVDFLWGASCCLALEVRSPA